MTSGESRGPGRRIGPLVIVAVVLLAGVAVAVWGISARARAMTQLTRETRQLAVPTVNVIRPQRSALQEDLTLPGSIQAYTDAAIYARTNGYLKRRYADLGSHVKAGQLLAEIDTPEVEQQLQAARADLATAEANAHLAQTTAERYRDLIKSESVSQQDLDNANGSLEAKRAAVQSAQFNVKRLEELQAFKKIYAPFDGVITARNTDIGALIQSGSNARELFHIASTRRLRVFVNVPQSYSRQAKPGLKAEVELKEFPGQRFAGTLVRSAQTIDPSSRTLLTEFEMDNPAGDLLPGSYGEVHMKLGTAALTFRLPVNTLIFRSEGLRIATVRDGRVALNPITIGRDFGSTVEVVAGLTGDEQVIVNPSDSLAAGQAVRVTPEPEGKGTVRP